jgi:hypothetical protein
MFIPAGSRGVAFGVTLDTDICKVERAVSKERQAELKCEAGVNHNMDEDEGIAKG